MSSNSNQSASVTREKLVEDVKILTKDVQELLKATASVVGEKAAEARVKVEESLKVAQDKLASVQDGVTAKGREAVAATDDYVRNNPWNAVGIAAGVGFLLGLGFAAGAFLRRRD
ncbi:MAG TPA: DUF883 family protein [Candidatus Methylacidiphilales bacterium]|nr:DUF883 family protein [Candidatus Methylacidiphilales bacterium]